MPDPNALLAKIRQAFEAIYRQQNRLLRVETTLGEDALIVERLQAREAINERFDFNIDCVAPSAQFELKALLGQRMTLRLHQPTGTPRVWHGYVANAAFLGADGGLARYRLTLAPWLGFLSLRRNCLVFQDLDAREIIERIFADYEQAAFSFDVTQPLPKRPLCTQFRETDLAFVERLLAEEGLSYHFEHDQDASNGDAPRGPQAHHRLRIFDKDAQPPELTPASIRFHRVSPTETEDAITAFRPRQQLAPNTASLSAWDALQVKAHAASASADAADLPPLEIYNGATSNPRHINNAALQQSTEHTLAAARLRVNTASGDSSARHLAPASAFNLTQHPTADGRYIAIAVEHSAANNLGAHLAHLLDTPDMEFGSYRNRFVCLPDTTDIVSTRIPKPPVLGPEPALVVGIADETITSQRDNQVKIQFPWQRGKNPNPGGLTDANSQTHPDGNAPGDETAGIWVRVAQRIAGPNWGASFVPRIGAEVLVEYLDGDCDTPIITGQFYNGQDTPPFAAGVNSAANHPGTISGIQTQGLDGQGNNQWIIDDAPGQLRQSLNTTQANSQLNLGYLIDQNGSTRGNYRGQGFELTTAGWAALRAPQGLLLSATARQRGASAAMDVSETVAQLNAAEQRASTLSDAATAQGASPLNANTAQTDFTKAIDPEQDGVFTQNVGGQDFHKHKPGTRDKDAPAERFNQASILLDSPSSIAATTPASSLLYAGQNTHTTTQGEAQQSAGATHSSVSGSTTSLFTHEGGIKAVAANGPLSLQAHDDKLEILADDSMTVTSSKERVNVFAQTKIVLTSGQSSITLEGGNITFACPGTFTVQGGTHDFVGPAKQPADLADLPTGSVNMPGFGDIEIQEAGFVPDEGVDNPFVDLPDEEAEEEQTHHECDLRRLQRDIAESKVNLHASSYAATRVATGTGPALDAESISGVAKDMVDNYGKVGAAAKVGRWSSLASFLTEKAIKKGFGYDSAIQDFQGDQYERTIEAQKKLEAFESQVEICETDAEEREQAAAEQKEVGEAMDYLNKKSEVEREISGIALAAALTNTGAMLTFRDFEYRHSRLFPETESEAYTQAQQAYADAPQWDPLSQRAQQGHDELLTMAEPVINGPDPSMGLPPPSVRERELENLRSIRDDMRNYYDANLKPIWGEVMEHWANPQGGVT